MCTHSCVQSSSLQGSITSPSHGPQFRAGFLPQGRVSFLLPQRSGECGTQERKHHSGLRFINKDLNIPVSQDHYSQININRSTL